MKPSPQTPQSGKAIRQQEVEEFQDEDCLESSENDSQLNSSIVSFEIDSNKQHLEATNQGVVKLMMAVYQNHLHNSILSDGYANQKPPNDNLLESVNTDDFILPALEKTILLNVQPEDSFYEFLNEIFAEHPTFISQELIIIALRVRSMFLSIDAPEVQPELLVEFGKNLHQTMSMFLYQSLTIFGEQMQKSLSPTNSKEKVLRMRSQFLEGYCSTVLLVLKGYFENPLITDAAHRNREDVMAENNGANLGINNPSENVENPSIMTLYSLSQSKINEQGNFQSSMDIEKQNSQYIPTETYVLNDSDIALAPKDATNSCSSAK